MWYEVYTYKQTNPFKGVGVGTIITRMTQLSITGLSLYLEISIFTSAVNRTCLLMSLFALVTLLYSCECYTECFSYYTKSN